MQPLWLIFIPLIPLLGFLLNGAIAFQRARNKGAVSHLWVTLIGCAAPLASLALSLRAFFVLRTGQNLSLPQVWNWMNVDDVSVSLNLTVNRLSVVMILSLALLGFAAALLLSRKQKTNKNGALPLVLLNLVLFVAIVIVMSGLLNFFVTLAPLIREILWIASLVLVPLALCLILFKVIRRRRKTKINVRTNPLKTLVLKPLTWFARTVLDQGVDRVVVDGFLLNGTARFAGVLSSSLSRFQTGSLNFYLLILASTLLAVLAWILL